MKVKVYFNLHKKLFSVVDMSTGKVAFHSHDVLLKDATFKVRPGGRAKVLATGVKNVHAFVIGTLAGLGNDAYGGHDLIHTGTKVTYNPFKFSTFVTAYDGNTPVLNADLALLKVSTDKKGGILIGGA